MPSAVSGIIDELMLVMGRGDVAGFHRLFGQLLGEGRQLSPDELTAAIGELEPMLACVPRGLFSRLALAAGAFTEWGGSPLPLADRVPACALLAMVRRDRFSKLWPQVAGDRPEPDPDQAALMAETVDLFGAAAGTLGLPQGEEPAVAVAWYDAPAWVNLMITVLGQREFRAATTMRPRLARFAKLIARQVPQAGWLRGLASVLDGEPLIVIDHTGRHGFQLTMSGIGDNFQLHTLLADRLIGDPARGYLAGQRPEPAWVATATTAPPCLGIDHPTKRRFRLFDGTGAYIYPEGLPSEIPLTGGARLIVAHPPRGSYGWDPGRTYEHMTPELTLDHIMNPEQAAIWHSRAAPARETDLFGRHA